MTLATSIVGAGILGLPFALASSGWLLGVCLFALSSWINLVAMDIVSDKVAQVHAPRTEGGAAIATMEDIVRVFLGRAWARTSQAMVVVSALGSCVAYLIIVDGLCRPVIAPLLDPASIFASRAATILFFAFGTTTTRGLGRNVGASAR